MLTHSLSLSQVSQRMRLENEQLVEWTKRVQKATKDNVSAMLLATPPPPESPSVPGDEARTTFQQNLVKYLTERNAAGVVQLDLGAGRGDGVLMMYLFPPGELAEAYLKNAAMELDMSAEENYLLVVLIQE